MDEKSTALQFEDFLKVVNRLRRECPWDKEQTNDSIKDLTIEEAYEVVSAIEEKNYDELKKELGDLFFHVLFHSKIAEDEGKFNINDVIESVQEKMIRRHPHVFGDTVVKNSNDVKLNWEQIKLSEGRNSVLEGLPANLPSLQRAHRLQEKAAKVGFDWGKIDDVWSKVKEEIEEVKEAAETKSHEELEKEFGDLLFALVNYARWLNIHPENALRKTNNKFISRFNYVQTKIEESGKKLTESNLEEMDKHWEESKKYYK